MKARTLLALGLIGAFPSFLLAQPQPQLEPVVAPAPVPPRPPAPLRVAVTPAPALASTMVVPPAPLPEAQQAPPAPKSPPPPAPATAPPSPPAPPRHLGQLINVRIDVTLSDSKGATKTLTMTVADGESAMNRTTTNPGMEYSFNADAGPTVVGNKIRLRLTADAIVPAEEKGFKLALRQSQTVILGDGEAVEVARANDPTSERAFVLSVKATIQR